MADVFPTIPEKITVHLGPPDSNAQNVTVSFIDYIKNVASSEIYPTWNEEAIKANIYAQISYALNRIYTEFYPSRGYDFDITSSTATDQKFIYGRNIFENIDRIVDEIFDSYIRRIGFIEPLAAKYCNGTTVTCNGLSQWGSENLANMGYSAFDILRYYYGDNIELVFDVPVRDFPESYPGFSLRRGNGGMLLLSRPPLIRYQGIIPQFLKFIRWTVYSESKPRMRLSVFKEYLTLPMTALWVKQPGTR